MTELRGRAPVGGQAGEGLRPAPLRSAVAGLAVSVLLAATGAALLARQGDTWAATARLVVTATSAEGGPADPGYGTALARGQLVNTVVQELAAQDPEPLLAAGGLPTRTAREVVVRVQPVVGTAVVAVRATAGTAATAEAAADLVAAAAGDVVRLAPPYRLTPVSPAAGSATRTGLDRGSALVAVLVAALLAGFATQQLFWHLTLLHRPSPSVW